ncbi:MAG: hypothetical protein LBP33_11055 [Candidatus Adiutrix sp.]|jgi:hypothetical protein|nr:hypothetical protein [Candidatus Adiutrix sp.]
MTNEPALGAGGKDALWDVSMVMDSKVEVEFSELHAVPGGEANNIASEPMPKARPVKLPVISNFSLRYKKAQKAGAFGPEAR